MDWSDGLDEKDLQSFFVHDHRTDATARDNAFDMAQFLLQHDATSRAQDTNVVLTHVMFGGSFRFKSAITGRLAKLEPFTNAEWISAYQNASMRSGEDPQHNRCEHNC